LAPAARAQLAAVLTSLSVHALNDSPLIAGVFAFAGAVASLTLIWRKDFADASDDVVAVAPKIADTAPELELAASASASTNQSEWSSARTTTPDGASIRGEVACAAAST
jgi:hypothetical protein